MPVRLASFLPPAFLSAVAAAAIPLAPHSAAVVQENVTEDAHVTPAAPVAPVRQAAAASYTARPGDTLALIAGRVCRDPGDYWALAYNNNVANPDLIYAGQVFQVACQAAAQAIADRYGLLGSSPASSPVHYVSHQSDAPAPAYHHSSGAVVSSVSGTYAGGNSMQECIIARESGGNSQVVNATGHYGLYQFSEQTWEAHGGSPADFGHASVAEQNQVYYNTVAQDGYSDWVPYDHC